MGREKTVVVGMSGGVDSSVSALLLKEQGYHVIGLFMNNWEEQDENGVCTATKDYEDVQRVCEKIDIPYYALNFSKEYKDQVFSHFIHDFEKGLTPNPDILCNREIKFKLFFDKAMELGADFFATGHYCQNINENEVFSLHKGADPKKDQTYFLYTLQQEILKKVLFPVGGLPKSEVRKIALAAGLKTAEKKDSTGICFIGERNFRSFLSQYIAIKPGNIETLDGKIVGKHLGAAFYTIGQRKGLGIGGEGDAWFVVGKEMAKNTVYVVQGQDHPALFSTQLIAEELSWINEPPSHFPYQCASKVRYRQADHPCVIEKIEDGKATITFLTPQRAVTPGQSIVFYEGSRCIGGGVIMQNKNDLDIVNKEYYNTFPASFDKIPFKTILPDLILKHFVEPKSEILEIGSGPGALAFWLTHLGHSLTCIEPAEKPAKMAREKGLNVTEIKFQDFETQKKFDYVLAISSLIHIPKSDIPAQLKKIATLLKSRGLAIVSFLEGKEEGYADPASEGRERYFSKFTESEIKELLSDDFVIVETHQIQRTHLSFFLFVLQLREQTA